MWSRTASPESLRKWSRKGKRAPRDLRKGLRVPSSRLPERCKGVTTGLPREPAGGFGAEGPARRGGRASAGAAPCRPGPHQRPPHGGHAGGDSNPLAGQARLGCARNREGEEGRHRPKGKETHLKASKKALAAFGSHAIAQCVQRGFGRRLSLGRSTKHGASIAI